VILLHKLKGVNLHEIYCEERKKKAGRKEGVRARDDLQRLGYDLYCVERFVCILLSRLIITSQVLELSM